MSIDSAKPEDFERFWTTLDHELEQLSARPVLEPLPLHSSDEFTVYWVSLTSVGPYRIGGYLSVPTGAGPFPAKVITPRYGSVTHVPHYNDRVRFVCLALMHRGQRLADTLYSSAYPGLLTAGIEDPNSFVYRSIVADCLRGVEYVLDHPEVDRKRVALSGDDLGLIAASRRPEVAFVHSSGVMIQKDALTLYRVLEACDRSSAYPLEEISDFLRSAPDKLSNVRTTLSYFDPIHHVPAIRATTLIEINDTGAIGGPEWVQPLSQAFGGQLEYYQLTHEGGTDQDQVDRWLAEQLYSSHMPRFQQEISRLDF